MEIHDPSNPVVNYRFQYCDITANTLTVAPTLEPAGPDADGYTHDFGWFVLPWNFAADDPYFDDLGGIGSYSYDDCRRAVAHALWVAFEQRMRQPGEVDKDPPCIQARPDDGRPG